MLSSVLWIYLIPLAVILFALAALVTRIHQRRRQLVAGGHAATLAGEPERSTRAMRGSPLASPPAAHAPAVVPPHRELPRFAGPAASSQSDVAAELVGQPFVFSSDPGPARRTCPCCQRRFHVQVDSCPFDGTPLHPERAAAANQVPDRSTFDTPIAAPSRARRQQCRSCGRRFEADARFCYADGQPLVPDTDEDARYAAPIKVCKSCGFEAGPDVTDCPFDGTTLSTIAADEDSRIAPPIPLLICKRCSKYALPGAAFCPDDGEVLTPVLNARLTALPTTGFGTRRKLCRKCGTRFAHVCTYCAYDGTRLTPIN